MYEVEITLSSGLKTSNSYATEDAAWEARDRAFTAGFNQVRILGLPETVYIPCVEIEIEDLLIILEDESQAA